MLYTVLANGIALFVSDKILEGLTIQGGYVAFLIAGGTIAILNIIIKPIIKFLAFPLIFLSAGLVLILINAFILYLAKYLLGVMAITGVAMQVDNLLTFVFTAIIFGVANWFISWLTKQ